MDELIKNIFDAPIANLLIVAGLVFLIIAVIGKVSGKIDPGKTGRISAAGIGAVLLLIGLILYVSSTKVFSPPQTIKTTTSDETKSKLPTEETKLIETEELKPTKDPSLTKKILSKPTKKPDLPVQKSSEVAGMISNFRVVDVVLKADPIDYKGPCPVEISFNGRISAIGGSGNLSYRFLRSDGETSQLQKLRFDSSGSKVVSTSWKLGAPTLADFSGWQSIQILEPQELNSKQAIFKISCVTEVKRVKEQKQEKKSTQHMVDHPESYLKISDWSFFVAFNGVGMLSNVKIKNTSNIDYKDIIVRVGYYTGSGVEISHAKKSLPVVVPANTENNYLNEGLVLGASPGDVDVKNIQVLGAVPVSK
ncbi:MAG: hypothetical protein ACE5H1_04040 [Thermodesulfobacteriota bacterium]